MKSAEHMKNIKTLIADHGTEETLTICEEKMADVPIYIDMFFLLLDLADIELGHEIRTKVKRNMERI